MHKHIAPGANALRHTGCASRGSQGEHPARERLAATQNIRRNTGPFRSKHLARAAKARGDFIKYQQRASLAAQLRKPAQVFGVVKPHAARALHHWFKNHRRNLVPAHGKNTPGIVKARRIKGLVKAATWPLHKYLLGQHGREQAVHARNRVAHRHGAKGIPMVTAPRRKKLATPGLAPALLVLQSHFQGHLHRHRTGIGKKHALKPRRHEAQQPFGQIDRRFVRQAAKHHVGHAPGLCVQGLHKARMVVAVHGCPPGRHAVHKFPAVCQHNAVGSGARYSAEQGRLHGRGVGVPDGLVIAAHNIRSAVASSILRGLQMPHQRFKLLSQSLPALCIQLRHARQFHKGSSLAMLRQPLAQHGGIVGQHGVHIHAGATRCRVGGGNKHHSGQLQTVMPQCIH